MVNPASAFVLTPGGAQPSGDQSSASIVDRSADQAFSGELVLLEDLSSPPAGIDALVERSLPTQPLAEPPSLVAFAARAETFAAPPSIPANAADAAAPSVPAPSSETFLAPDAAAQFRRPTAPTVGHEGSADDGRAEQSAGAARGGLQTPTGEVHAGFYPTTQTAKGDAIVPEDLRGRADGRFQEAAQPLVPADGPDSASPAAAPARSFDFSADRLEPAPAAPPGSENDVSLPAARVGGFDDWIAPATAARAGAGPDLVAGPSASTRSPVAFALASIARREDGVLELRLDPPDLGAVSIRFTEGENGYLHAFLNADEPATLELLRRHGELLQRELIRHGAGDFTLSFADRRDGRGAPGAGGAHRTHRIGETPDLFVATQASVTPPLIVGRIDLVA